MIYLITGVPGSGKTLYAVSTLIRKLAAEKLKDKKGNDLTRRVLIDGIPDLLIPHEVLPELTEVETQGKTSVWTSEGDGLDKWPHWCKPGDIIVVDEAQRYWRPRGLGTKPPEMIKALETHRHMGVDFVIITQNPMLIDQNVRRLVGRHQHVRRLFGAARALIYDWDSCNVVVSNTKGSTSSLWSYPKDAFKLYKSSALHIKQRQKLPIWLFLPVVAIVAGLVVMPKAFGTLAGAMTGKGVGSSQVVKAPLPSASAARDGLLALSPVPAASGPAVAASAPMLPASSMLAAVERREPEKFGCVAFGKKCSCYSKSGASVVQTVDACFAQVRGQTEPGQKTVVPSGVREFAATTTRPGDLETLAWMTKRKRGETLGLWD